MTDPLLHFKNPPVIETVLGVQFDPIPGLGAAHLGEFWHHLGPEWPQVIDAPALDPQYETFGEETPWGSAFAGIRIEEKLSIRIQYKNEQGDRMIQVQNGRFHFNWLGGKGPQYPRYTTIRPDFDRYWSRFQDYLIEKELGKPSVNQWEITYVNHIPQGKLWASPGDWQRILRIPAPSCVISGLSFERLDGNWHYEIKPQKGRLHLTVQHVKSKAPEQAEVLRVTLTARGPVSSGSDVENSLDDGLSLGRETIVRTFCDLTTETAHKEWGVIE